MKKSIIYRYTLSLLGLICLISCNKVLDILPTDSIETNTAYRNVSDLDQGVVGVYTAIYEENTIYTGAIMSDEVRWALDNVRRNYGIEHKWDFDSGAGNVTAAWTNLYVVIDRANRALAGAERIETTSSEENATRDRLRGELLALRAFAHFELLRNYASSYESNAMGIPIMLTSVITTPYRNTFGEVIAQVEADLSAAKALIPATYSIADFSRITRLAVSALQARVALYNKEWDNAITYATEVINGRPLATIANYTSIWNDASTTEVIFRLARTTNSVNLLWTDSNRDVFFSPSYKLINAFDPINDVRYARFITQDLTLPVTSEQWKVNKYPGQTTAIVFNHVKVFRTSEMYLIRAESYVQASSANLANAAGDINTLRTNRINGYLPIAYLNAADALTDIYLERFKELAFEGHRYYDYRRRFAAIIRDPADLTTATNIGGTLNTTDRNYVLPIPAAELLANPNIMQNPGY